MAGKTSDNNTMPIGGRIDGCAATLCIHCLGLGTVNAGKTSDTVKMAAAGRQPLPWHRNRWQDIGQRQDGRCRPSL
jgi:hypothetical protein